MPQPKRLPRPARRAFLVAHVTVSVGWLGVSLCLLTLAITAVRDPDAFALPAATAMKLFADWLLVPLALLSLSTGLVLSLGTTWGLARHRWVWVKFWLTLAATGLTVFSFKPGADEAAALAASGNPVTGTDLLVPPAVSLSLYVFLTAVSVLKPWGLTGRGRRLRDARTRGAARTRRDARTRRAARTRGDAPARRSDEPARSVGAGTGSEAGAGARTTGKSVATPDSRQPA